MDEARRQPPPRPEGAPRRPKIKPRTRPKNRPYVMNVTSEIDRARAPSAGLLLNRGKFSNIPLTFHKIADLRHYSSKLQKIPRSTPSDHAPANMRKELHALGTMLQRPFSSMRQRPCASDHAPGTPCASDHSPPCPSDHAPGTPCAS